MMNKVIFEKIMLLTFKTVLYLLEICCWKQCRNCTIFQPNIPRISQKTIRLKVTRAKAC